jgi:hypothetical protein
MMQFLIARTQTRISAWMQAILGHKGAGGKKKSAFLRSEVS